MLGVQFCLNPRPSLDRQKMAGCWNQGNGCLKKFNSFSQKEHQTSYIFRKSFYCSNRRIKRAHHFWWFPQNITQIILNRAKRPALKRRRGKASKAGIKCFSILHSPTSKRIILKLQFLLSLIKSFIDFANFYSSSLVITFYELILRSKEHFFRFGI